MKRSNHGLRYTPEYESYARAKQRCTNPKHPRYKDYGGRGIKFKFDTFEEFFAEIGLRPSENLSLDRTENDKHYEIGNIKWSSRKEQRANRRKRTHCYKGHLLSKRNIMRSGEATMCRICHNRRSLSGYHRRKKEKHE